MNFLDVIVVGAGQAGLSVAYFLRRTRRSVVLLDAEQQGGGAWQHAWDSLRLFSPAQWSAIAGWPMPDSGVTYPHRDDVVDYLRRYEQRYQFDIRRPVQVTDIVPVAGGFRVVSAQQHWYARTVVCTTGTWRHPYIPAIRGREGFAGRQLHSAFYSRPEEFADQRVLIVGGANSGAQILAEVSLTAADTTWVTLAPPAFLPDEVDGRVLFERATERWRALQAGRTPEPAQGLGSIVMVPAVRAARQRGVLQAQGPLAFLEENQAVWPDGSSKAIDAIIWCTGFRPALQPLSTLGIVRADGTVRVQGTRVPRVPGLWLVGYGEWTGMASATLVGVMRTARSTAKEVDSFIGAR